MTEPNRQGGASSSEHRTLWVVIAALSVAALLWSLFYWLRGAGSPRSLFVPSALLLMCFAHIWAARRGLRLGLLAASCVLVVIGVVLLITR
ncbi:MAG TPA: hypothetical protein VG148_15040 [Pyrinomonadaceae bacterium]|nr:hypothetical protein [Pyrinomonadaceae bacterium]